MAFFQHHPALRLYSLLITVLCFLLPTLATTCTDYCCPSMAPTEILSSSCCGEEPSPQRSGLSADVSSNCDCCILSATVEKDTPVPLVGFSTPLPIPREYNLNNRWPEPVILLYSTKRLCPFTGPPASVRLTHLLL